MTTEKKSICKKPSPTKAATKAGAKAHGKPTARTRAGTGKLGAEEAAPNLGGRPTDYRPEYAALGKKFCLLGATDKDLGRMFEVEERTINRWKRAHPEFLEALREGKDVANAEIAHALYHRAKGYSHEEVHVSSYQGQITLTPLIKHYPPDTAAASLFLRNRVPEKWRDKVDTEHFGADGGPIQIQKIERVIVDPQN